MKRADVTAAWGVRLLSLRNWFAGTVFDLLITVVSGMRVLVSFSRGGAWSAPTMNYVPRLLIKPGFRPSGERQFWDHRRADEHLN